MIVRSEYFIGIKHLLKGRAVTQVRSASWVVNGTLWPWANHLTSLGFMFLFFCCFFIFIYLLIYFLWYWELNSWPMFARQVLYPLSHAFLFFFSFFGGTGGLSSWPCTCLTRALPLEPHPQTSDSISSVKWPWSSGRRIWILVGKELEIFST
jgi:hypothetical protein